MTTPYSVLTEYELRHLPSHLMGSGWWQDLCALLTDLQFVEVKCAAGMVERLVADYRKALLCLPDARSEQKAQNQRDERLARYTAELIDYARHWNKVREQQKHPSKRQKPAPQSIPVPNPPRAIRPRTNRNATSQTVKHTTRLSQLRAFAQFVSAEAHALARFGAHRGFCAQQAHDFARSGPVAEAAEGILELGPRHPMILCAPHSRGVLQRTSAAVRTIAGHAASVARVAMTPDGHWAISWALDRTFRLWDLKKRVCLSEFSTAYEEVTALELTADGRFAFIASRHGVLHVCDLETKHSTTLVSRNHPILGVAITADGSLAVVGDNEGRLHVWDVKSKRQRRLEADQEGDNWALAMTPEGRIAVSSHIPRVGWPSPHLLVWDIEAGRIVRALGVRDGHGGDIIRCVALSQDGHTAVSGDGKGRVCIWNTEVEAPVHVLEAHDHEVGSVCLTADGRYALSAASDSTLRIWDTKTGRCLRRLSGRGASENCALMSADGRFAISGGYDGGVLLWDLESAAIDSNASPASAVTGLRVAPKKQHVLSGSKDGALSVWELQSGRCVYSFASKTTSIDKLDVNAGGRVAVSIGSKNDLTIWDIKARTCVATKNNFNVALYNAVRLTPDARVAVTVRADGELRVWDIKSGQLRHSLARHRRLAMGLWLTADGRFGITSGADDTLRLWDIERGTCLRTVPIPSGGRVRALTLDGRVALCADREGSLRTYELERAGFTLALTANLGSLERVSVTPDGRRFVTWGARSDAHHIRVWDLRSGQVSTTIELGSSLAARVRFTRDARYALTDQSPDGMCVWGLDSGRRLAVYSVSELQTACSDFQPDGRFAIGMIGGAVRILRLANLRLRNPVVTAARLWLFGGWGGAGHWDDLLSALCPWCGSRFVPDSRILDAITGIAREARLSPDDAPCLALPGDAWEERRLNTSCPECDQPLIFNPFVIDNRGRYDSRRISPGRRTPSAQGEWRAMLEKRSDERCAVCAGSCGQPSLPLSNGRHIGSGCLIRHAESASDWCRREEACCACRSEDQRFGVCTQAGWLCMDCITSGLEAICDAQDLESWDAREITRALSRQGTLTSRLTVLWRFGEVDYLLETQAPDALRGLNAALVRNLGFVSRHPMANDVRQLALKACIKRGEGMVPVLHKHCRPIPGHLCANCILAVSSIAPDSGEFRELAETGAQDCRRRVRKVVLETVQRSNAEWAMELAYTLRQNLYGCPDKA